MEIPALPRWAQQVAEENSGDDIKFFTVMTLKAEDISRDFNRIRFPEEANDSLRAYLFEDEKKAIDILHIENHDYSDSNIRRNNSGLEVSAYFTVYEDQLELTSWDGLCFSTCIKGNDYWPPPNFYNLKIGDNVAIWMFRRLCNDVQKLCFIFSKID